MRKDNRAQPFRKIETGVWPGEIPLESLYTAGVSGQAFFSALRDRGELVGTRCRPCDQVYMPARLFCERCFAELTEEALVKGEGTLMSFTFCSVDHDGQRLKQPLVLALVRLDGATTVFLHRLLEVSEPSQVRIGSRVRVVLKPKDRRTGSILDVEGFQIQ